jgi:hypothetical protein
MKFAYAEYQVTPTPATDSKGVIYRPVIPVRFIGPQTFRDVYALLDTGSDESYLTESMAKKLGVEPIPNRTAIIQSNGDYSIGRRSNAGLVRSHHSRSD